MSNQLKPAILQCFGDIAQAIGPHFETYLSVVATVLQQAATVTASPDSPFDMLDYVVSLREGIMDAWGGIIIAMKSDGRSGSCGKTLRRNIITNGCIVGKLSPYIDSIFQLLGIVAHDQNKSEPLLRSAMGVIG